MKQIPLPMQTLPGEQTLGGEGVPFPFRHLLRAFGGSRGRNANTNV